MNEVLTRYCPDLSPLRWKWMIWDGSSGFFPKWSQWTNVYFKLFLSTWNSSLQYMYGLRNYGSKKCDVICGHAHCAGPGCFWQCILIPHSPAPWYILNKKIQPNISQISNKYETNIGANKKETGGVPNQSWLIVASQGWYKPLPPGNYSLPTTNNHQLQIFISQMQFSASNISNKSKSVTHEEFKAQHSRTVGAGASGVVHLLIITIILIILIIMIIISVVMRCDNDETGD